MSLDPYEHVEAVMTTPVVVVGPEATLREVARTLTRADVGALVMEGADRPMSVISERDIVRALADGADPDAVWVVDIATEEPRYVTPHHSLVRAAEDMLVIGVRHLPVVDDNEVVGMLSARDALRSLTQSALARLSPPSHGRYGQDVEHELARPVA